MEKHEIEFGRALSFIQNEDEDTTATFQLRMVAKAVSHAALIPVWIAFEITYHRFGSTDLGHFCEVKEAQQLLHEMEEIKHEDTWDPEWSDAEKVAFAILQRDVCPEPGDRSSPEWVTLMTDVVFRQKSNERLLRRWLDEGDKQ